MKTKVGIIFGGCSSEYDVSLVSVTSVIKNINKEKYDVVLIGITKQGDFYLYQGDIEKIEKNEFMRRSEQEYERRKAAPGWQSQ